MISRNIVATVRQNLGIYCVPDGQLTIFDGAVMEMLATPPCGIANNKRCNRRLDGAGVSDLPTRFCIERGPIQDNHTGLTRLQYFYFIGIVIVLPVQADDFAGRRQPLIAQEFNIFLNVYPLFQGAVKPTRRTTPLTLRRH